MDILYDDLENYEEGNIIQDLKNENKDLKQKLEKYSHSLNQLQVDFDKLSSEYKKLELNYSSLLKTARAEIERKTNMITQLNLEKDMFVIQAFQKNGKRAFRNTSLERNKPDPPECKLEKGIKREVTTKDVPKDVHNTNHVEKAQATMKSQMKENVPDEKKSRKSHSISNRRKSMPDSSYESRSSHVNSDEETESRPWCKDKRMRCIERLEKKGSRTSEGSSIEDKKSNSDFFSNRNSRDRYSNEYGQRNRYRPKSRNRNFRSPERETTYNFSGRYRRKFRRSKSPPDRFARHKSRDRRTNYDTQYSHMYETPFNDEKPGQKHKLSEHHDEPCPKKIKDDVYEPYTHTDEKFSDDEYIDPNQTVISPEPPFSCQSPEQPKFNDDGFNKQQFLVKEIMPTATTRLDDPRLTSKRYVLETVKGKEILRKATSQEDLFIKPIDKSLWLLPKVTMPDALLNKPPSLSNSENLDLIYSDIDNFNLNTSIESVEEHQTAGDVASFIKSHEDFDSVVQKVQKEVQHKMEVNSKLCSEKLCQSSDNKETIPYYEHPKQLNENLTSNLERLDANKNTNNKILLDFTNITDKQQQSSPENKNSEVAEITHFQDHDQPVISSIDTVERDLLLSDDASDYNVDYKHQTLKESPLDKLDKHKETDLNSTVPDKKIAQKETILSSTKDKTNDVTSQDKIGKQSHKNKVKRDKSYKINSSQSNDKFKDEKCSDKHTLEATKQNKLKNCTLDQPCKDNENLNKKHKSKRKSPDLKPIDEVKDKTKDKKETNLEIKSKFSELFGDSNSLITPEDIGITKPESTLVPSDNVASIIDDTQSAVDLVVGNFNPSPRIEDTDVSNCLKKVTHLENNPLSSAGTKTDSENKSSKINSSCDKNVGDLYENMNPVSMDSSNIVIISTGIQSKGGDLAAPDVNKLIDQLAPQTEEISTIEPFATSTPFKTDTMLAKNVSENSEKLTEVSNNDSVHPKAQLNAPDVPDVRIFVKRRKKVKKS